MIFESGEKVHIIERRYFSDDPRRHFIGEVIKSIDQIIRLRGHAWTFDAIRGEFIRKPEPRERVLPLTERLVINIIPREVNLDQIKYVILPNKSRGVTDGGAFTLDISEFTQAR